MPFKQGPQSSPLAPAAGTSQDHFSDAAIGVVQGVRQALEALYDSVHADPRQPQDISRRFGLDKTLTWRVARTVSEENAWDAVVHIPRRPSVLLLTNAFQKAGAPSERIARVIEQCDAFDRFVETHAGDRETFEIMVAGRARREGAKKLEQFRKAGYQAGCAVWGVSARVQFAARLVSPSAVPDMLDLTTVCGFADLRRLRPNLPWTIATVWGWSGIDLERAEQVQPLDSPARDPAGTPLLHFGGGGPRPRLRSVPDGKRVRVVLEPGHVGSAAALDLVLGYIVKGDASAVATEPGEMGEHGVFINTPCELMVQDVLLHESLAYAVTDAAAYSTLPGAPAYPSPDAEEGRLPVPAEVTDMGRADGLPVFDCADYRHGLEAAATSLGMRLSAFRAYRVMVTYPPVPSLFLMRHPLRQR